MTWTVPAGPFRVSIVVGTRPEAIKLAPVVWALQKRAKETKGIQVHELRIVFTGQHEELLDTATRAVDLAADVSFGIMQPDQDLYHVGIECLKALRQDIQKWRPHVLLVQGDTATVFYTALGAFFEKIPLAHVEAGLRSHNKWAPYPEEVFRRFCDMVADIHFAPTHRARESLLRENVPAEGIFVTGNTVVDAVQKIAAAQIGFKNRTLESVIGHSHHLVLITVHRREAFGQPIREIFGALARLAREHRDVSFIYPVHPNPKVREPANEILSHEANLHLLEPLAYSDLVKTLKAATLVLTDSGGIQEEAPSFGVPVLVLRDVTERPEGIEAGVARLVGTRGDRIFEEADRLLRDEAARLAMSRARNPYGDGRAGERIADVLLHKFRGLPRRNEDWA